LDREIARWSSLGFAVVRGGTHPRWGTENALIVLGDGSYLELLAVRPGEDLTHRFWRQPDGSLRPTGTFAAFALGVSDLDSVITRLRAASVACSDAEPGSRIRPDGVRLEWRLAFLQDPALPFLIEDVTPRIHRVPPPPASSLNVACSLGLVSVVTADLTRSMRAYAALADTAPSAAGEHTVIRAGATSIRLRPPHRPDHSPGVERIGLRIPQEARPQLPVTYDDGAPVIVPEAVGGLCVALLDS